MYEPALDIWYVSHTRADGQSRYSRHCYMYIPREWKKKCPHILNIRPLAWTDSLCTVTFESMVLRMCDKWIPFLPCTGPYMSHVFWKPLHPNSIRSNYASVQPDKRYFCSLSRLLNKYIYVIQSFNFLTCLGSRAECFVPNLVATLEDMGFRDWAFDCICLYMGCPRS